ncbi:TetR/AcrR family transcriptional regulator [Mycobacterium colombiense]|uniref:Transcriptional regulator n=1 Tax=Mycobacterium colombiense CECT 3035 TaxID=1041522 RepID=J4TIV3_9MYCO|nr:TetR/AcrR family transcriptional regulator C-terminal domain-containing protein [Mycobacterium colombiense]EJO89503.1 transcriptional regulator [Mycobacterium colombiense CECT 3035]
MLRYDLQDKVPAEWSFAIPATKGAGDSTARAPRRAKPPTLTEDQIVDAALNVIRAEGLDALSMRRLSRELGRSAMAAYWYVADKSELLDLVARKLLSRVDVPAPESGPWDERLRAVIHAIDEQLHRYPGMANVLLERMKSTDRRVLNAIMEILVSAGLQGRDVHLAYATIHTYLFGRYQVVGLSDDLHPPGELEDTLAELMPHLNGLRGRDYFNFGLDTIIDGLRARSAATPSGRRRRRA